MKARDRLWELYQTPDTASAFGDALDELLREHAHELAEKIRKQTARGNLIRPEFAQAWEQGLHVGADLIDPEEHDEEETGER